MPTVFISHSTRDDAHVDRIAQHFRDAGIETWVDHQRGIQPGDPFDERIQAAIQNCDAMLFAASPDSVVSEECTAEWRYLLALRRRGDPKRLFTAMIRATDINQFPYRLAIYQYVSLEKDFDGGLQTLTEAINGGRERLPDAAPAVVRGVSVVGFEQMPDPDALRLIPMIGREADLQSVLSLLPTRMVMLIGVGGLGKSKLAWAAAQHMSGISGVVWQYALTQPRIDDLFDLLAGLFELERPVQPDALLNHPRLRETLIVIDNAESVTDAGQRAQFALWLKRLHERGAKVLITSRRAWDELPNARPISPGGLDATTAAQIAHEMLTYAGKDDLIPHAAVIAEAAKRHPRLIEFAVGLMKRRPYTSVMRELGALKQSAKGQEALDEMIVKTVAQMTAEEGAEPEAALRRLNVCRGTFALDAAAAILDLKADEELVLTLLETLQKWQFAALEGSERYRIDPLVIEAVDEDEGAHPAHYDYFYALAQFHHKKQSYYLLEPDSANLEAAFEWAITTDAEWALWYSKLLDAYLFNRERFRQLVDWAERVAVVLENHPDRWVRANAQYSLGNAYRYLGEHETSVENLKRAIHAFEQALIDWTPSAAPMDYAAAQHDLGVTYAVLALFEDEVVNAKRALHAYEQALIYWTPDTDPTNYARAQNSIGATYDILSQYEDQVANLTQAIAAYRQALIHRTPADAPLDYAGTQYNLGTVYFRLSTIEDEKANLQQAVTAFEAALTYWTPNTAPVEHARAIAKLGATSLVLGDNARALACWRVAESIFRQYGYNEDAGKVREAIAWVEPRLGGEG